MTTNKSTDTAQRVLIERVADLEQTPGGIAGFVIGLEAAVTVADESDFAAMAQVWRALVSLAESVRADLSEVVNG